jgi:hypothetical protein
MTTTTIHKPRGRDLTGQTFGTLTVLERDGHSAHMLAWLCRCTCGAVVTKRGTYLTSGTTRTCGDSLAHKRAANGTGRDYHAAHARLRAAYGPASDYTCPCGQPAAVWSFLGCEEAIVGPGGTNPYCLHACPDEYQPQCVPCSRFTDLLVRAAVR